MDKSLKIQYYAYHTMNFPLNFEALKKLCKENNTGFNDDKHIFIYNEIKKLRMKNHIKKYIIIQIKMETYFVLLKKMNLKTKKLKKVLKLV